jgi:hypothetical protein
MEVQDPMRRSIVMLGVIAALVAGGAARAEEAPPGKGFSFGARLGFGLPRGLLRGGDGHRGVAMREVVRGIIPAQLDAGYFLHSRIYVGASLQYALGLPAAPCIQGSTCNASALRLGANASYHLPWSSTLSPWLGLGAGLELFDPAQAPTIFDGEPPRAAGVFVGLEYFNVQGGADFHLGGSTWLGPFVTFAAGKYAGVDSQFHSWLIGGLRVQVRP